MNKERIDLVLSIPGIIVPFLGIGLVVILGGLEPGYNHFTKMMSVLGGVEGIRGVIFNVGISIIGILIILFAISLHRELNTSSHSSRIGTILLIIGSIGIMGAAIFHCNQDCANVVEMRTEGLLHILFALMTGMCLALAPIPIYFRLKEDPQWIRFAKFTIAAVIVSNFFGIILWVSALTDTREAISAVEGIIQRLGILFILIWIGVISAQMLIYTLNKPHSMMEN